MKLKTIYIYRHGESIGNIDWTNYCKMEDEEIPLSEKGKHQAILRALKLLTVVQSPTVALYSSHFHRALQTAEYVKQSFGDRVAFERIDKDMRELLWAPRNNIPDAAKQNAERETMRRFTGCNPGGESAKEVYDRMDGVIERLFTDFKSPDFPETVIMISHGIAMRCFMMKLLGWDTDLYEYLANPPNCQYAKIIVDPVIGSYRLAEVSYNIFKGHI